MSDRVGEGRLSSKKASKPQCFKCGKRGHLSKECTATGEERAAFKARQKENKANKANKKKEKEKEKTAGPSTSSAGAKGRKTRSPREPSLAQQAFEEPLIRSIILSFLNPYQPDDLKAVISFHQLGLMTTEDLDYYFRTTVPAINAEKIHFDEEEGSDFFIELLSAFEAGMEMVNTPLNVPRRMDNYFINDRMDVDIMKDIIRTCLCEDLDSWDKDGSKRKWLKGKSRAQVWKKYKYLSYVPMDVLVVYHNARELSKKLKKGIKDGRYCREETATYLLGDAVRAGMHREIGQLVKKYDALPDFYLPIPLTHMAAGYGHTETLKYLIEELGMDASANSAGNQNLVHWAAQSRRLDTLKYVCSSYNIDPHAIDDFGLSALHHAAVTGSVESCEYLIDELGLDPHMGDDIVRLPVMAGPVRYGHVNVVRLLMDKYKVDTKRELLLSFGSGDSLELIKLFVDTYKWDVNVMGSDGTTLVHRAVGAARSEELLHFLVDQHGMDINAKLKDGWNALHIAANENNANMLKLLVQKYGMDIRSRTNDGMTVADIALNEGSTEVWDVLTEELGYEHDYGEWDTDTDGYSDGYSDDESFEDDDSLAGYDDRIIQGPDGMIYTDLAQMLSHLGLDGGNRYGGHFDDHGDDGEFDDSEYSEEDSEYSEDSDEHEICSCCGGVIDPDGENSLATSRLDPTTGRPI